MRQLWWKPRCLSTQVTITPLDTQEQLSLCNHRSLSQCYHLVSLTLQGSHLIWNDSSDNSSEAPEQQHILDSHKAHKSIYSHSIGFPQCNKIVICIRSEFPAVRDQIPCSFISSV